ncbi:hypothetical protein GO013_03145 [Pseudodesulfovibrio sp. JC047]|uniref:magnetosome protein MamC n=1 Tax=Pseudodesulfovibrio sp. JC047 TaxID=2683199 RepID=UPI0013D80458|nr:magnetosome protein MamC [Pseudodesulfovibrio sp. JC047]NDV18414.1 hypothetical protein [Pseudodesulfovibrio sp. JC047]
MTQSNSTPSFARAAFGAALVGAIIGGTSAAAHGIRQVKNGTATTEDVARTVAREAGTTAVAAGTAGAVVGTFSLSPLVSSLGIVAVATGVKYAMDSLIGSPTPAIAQAEHNHAPLQTDQTASKTPPKKTPSKKTPAKKAAPKKKTTKKVTAKKTTTSKKTASKKASTPTTTGTPTKTAEKK